MKDMSAPVYPQMNNVMEPDGGFTFGASGPIQGLTKREYFAAMAMQGVVSNARLKEGITDEEVVKVAVAYADALLSALGGE